MEVHSKLLKLLLKSDPYYMEFLYGKNRSGYWEGNHTALQLEDVVDIFEELFDTDKFRLLIELDHSQAYKKYTPDVFLASKFNLKPGGKV